MNVVGHQHVGMDLTTTLERNLIKFAQVAKVVFALEEAGLPIVATLYDVLGNASKVESWSPWHA